MVPQNQTVLAGATVTLFCFSSSVARSSDGVIWKFENSTLNAAGEVLVMRNITVEMEGWYSCLTASGEVHSAYVDVIGETECDFAAFYPVYRFLSWSRRHKIVLFMTTSLVRNLCSILPLQCRVSS